MAKKRKFTRIPKIEVFVKAGVPSYTYGTFVAIADHMDNKKHTCFPSQKRLAELLNLSIRQIRRHIKILREAGLLEVIRQHRHRGRFSTNLYRVFFGKPEDMDDRPKSPRVYRRTKQGNTPPVIPPTSDEEYRNWQEQKRLAEDKKRKEGYEHLFEHEPNPELLKKWQERAAKTD